MTTGCRLASLRAFRDDPRPHRTVGDRSAEVTRGVHGRQSDCRSAEPPWVGRRSPWPHRAPAVNYVQALNRNSDTPSQCQPGCVVVSPPMFPLRRCMCGGSARRWSLQQWTSCPNVYHSLILITPCSCDPSPLRADDGSAAGRPVISRREPRRPLALFTHPGTRLSACRAPAERRARPHGARTAPTAGGAPSEADWELFIGRYFHFDRCADGHVSMGHTARTPGRRVGRDERLETVSGWHGLS